MAVVEAEELLEQRTDETLRQLGGDEPGVGQ
jgi:hypothetical protein